MQEFRVFRRRSQAHGDFKQLWINCRDADDVIRSRKEKARRTIKTRRKKEEDEI